MFTSANITQKWLIFTCRSTPKRMPQPISRILPIKVFIMISFKIWVPTSFSMHLDAQNPTWKVVEIHASRVNNKHNWMSLFKNSTKQITIFTSCVEHVPHSPSLGEVQHKNPSSGHCEVSVQVNELPLCVDKYPVWSIKYNLKWKFSAILTWPTVHYKIYRPINWKQIINRKHSVQCTTKVKHKMAALPGTVWM